MRVSARFPDSIGLYVGNDVAVLGIPVGTITAIRPAGTSVTVDMDLDADVRIPADATAVTLSPSLVTDRRVELTPVYRGGPVMRDGDVIPLDRTRTPVEIDRACASLDRLAAQLNEVTAGGGRPAVADALGVAADSLAGNGEKLRRSLHGIAEAIGVGADQRDQLTGLIRDVDHLSEVAAANDATIRSFSTNLTQATALADQQGPKLVRIVNNLNELLDRADRLVKENRPAGGRVLDNLRVTTSTLADHSRELTETVDVLPTLIQNLINVVDPVRKVVQVHTGIDSAVVDGDLDTAFCERLAGPKACGGSPEDPKAGLARMLTGGGR
jgi:virulence factor Mce-like protein